jgi:hypothetical protein
MAIPELEKLAENERNEFDRLYHMRPFEMTSEQKDRWKYFITKIDAEKYGHEKIKEEASRPHEELCTIVSRNPCLLMTSYGEIKVPDDMVPQEVKRVPDESYFEDTFYADMRLDLDNNKATSVNFKGYLKKMTQEELNDFWDKMPIIWKSK